MPWKKKKQFKEPDAIIPLENHTSERSIEACNYHFETIIMIQGDGKGAAAPPLGHLFGRSAGSTAFNSSKSLKKQWNCLEWKTLMGVGIQSWQIHPRKQNGLLRTAWWARPRPLNCQLGFRLIETDNPIYSKAHKKLWAFHL